LTEKEETNFKEQIIGNLKTFLRDPINFRNNTNKNDNNLDDTIRKILDLWDKEDIFSKAIIIFFFYDRLNNFWATERVYRLGFIIENQRLDWIHHFVPETILISHSHSAHL